MALRTDLAAESATLAQDDAGRLDGVVSGEYTREGFTVTDVRVVNQHGADAVDKPIGRYLTLDVGDIRGEEQRAAAVLCDLITALLPSGPLLVAGLGNRDITPDALGPLAVERVLVTRHLVAQLPEYFGNWREVSALAPGVMGVTGMEVLEVLAGAVERVKPSAIVAIDALASRSVTRLCTTVQLADTGIVPGSGVANSRAALSRETLGVPVIAIGVPTVVDAPTLAADLCSDGRAVENLASLFVTPRDIDRKVNDMARLVGTALSMAAHGMAEEDIRRFMA